MALFRRSLCLLPALFALAPVALGQPIAPENKDRVLSAMQNTIQRQAFVPGVDFGQWPAFLEKRRPEVDSAPDIPSFALAVNSALRDFGISHIRLLTPQNVKTRTTGQAQGFGFGALRGESGLLITAVAPQSPAFQLGLETGDEILEVEGVANPPAVMIPAEQETGLFTIKKKRTGQVKHYMIAKKAYSTDRPNTLTWPEPSTAVLRIPSFSRTYDRKQIEGFVAEVTKKKAKALILDLRANGGGLVANCQHLLSLLSPPGTPFGTSVTRTMAERYAKETGGDMKDMVAVAKWAGPSSKTFKLRQPPYLGKLAILLDRGSASASEITGAVLKEHRNAILIGRPSAGAVLVSLYIPLRDPSGFEVQIPLSDYVSPGGMRLEKNPLKPDITVEAPVSPESDPVVTEALRATR